MIVTMKPLVCEYLLHHTLRELENEHGVCARLNATRDKFSANYDTVLSKPGDPVSEQCRGLVLRPREMFKFQSILGDMWKDIVVGETDVLARPMDRFYNYGDGYAAEVDWTDRGLRVYEKVDGTCIIMYWDPLHDKWHVATRSVPESDLPIVKDHVAIGNTTFSGLFWSTLETTYYEGVELLRLKHYDFDGWLEHCYDKRLTYVFELVSPYNQIVVVYPRSRIYLLACRDVVSGEERPIEDVELPLVHRPKTWPIKDVTSLSTFVDQASPAELEGAVVCDSHFRRMKVKNKSYVLAHRCKDTVMSSVRNALECVILEKVDDIAPLVPKEVADKLLHMQEKYVRYCKEIDANVELFKERSAGSRKDFAMLVKSSGDWGAPYFNMYEGKVANAREWFKLACEKGKLSATNLDMIIDKMGRRDQQRTVTGYSEG